MVWLDWKQSNFYSLRKCIVSWRMQLDENRHGFALSGVNWGEDTSAPVESVSTRVKIFCLSQADSTLLTYIQKQQQKQEEKVCRKITETSAALGKFGNQSEWSVAQTCIHRHNTHTQTVWALYVSPNCCLLIFNIYIYIYLQLYVNEEININRKKDSTAYTFKLCH